VADSEITTLSLDRYAPDAKALVVGAQALADASQHAEVTPLHLLSQCLTSDPALQEVFRRASASLPDLQTAVESALSRLPVARERSYLSSLLLDLLKRAEREAAQRPNTSVGVEHVLNALAQEVRGAAGEILGAFQIGPGALRPHLGALRALSPARPATNGDEGNVASYTSSLIERARAGHFGPVIGRDDELRRVLTILERRSKHHPLLVGETGVGKTTIVRALALRVAAGDVPTGLTNLVLMELDVGALVAGARVRGELEARTRRLLESLEALRHGVLVITNVDQVLAPGGQLSGFADLLRSAVEREAFRLLATTTPEGQQRIQERAPLLYRQLTPLAVAEPSLKLAAEMVRGAAGIYERHHGIRVSEEAVLGAVSLAKRYVPERFLPDSAFDLLDEAAAARRVMIDGIPPEMDRPIRRLQSLTAQLRALEGADDEVTARARLELQREADALTPSVERLKQSLERRRSAIAMVQGLEGELSRAEQARDAARQRGDVGRAGELEHVSIPELQERLRRAQAAAATAGVDPGQTLLDSSDIAQTLAIWTGIPVSKMLEAEAEKLSRMEERLGQRVVGQQLALTKVARAVRRSRVGLRDPRRPIGSFLFLGPSGVGKTELAKALAQFLFDDEQALTRMDMSEYMERHMAQRLLGAPPGYADSEQGGLLTEAVRRRPYSVLLFDEVEKAHQDVFNLLLQVLDDGRLTDGRGRLTDFSNTVVIMTSNIGSGRIVEADPSTFETEQGREQVRQALSGELRSFFRPEFLNRIGEVIIFGPLGKEQLSRIVDIQLARVQSLLESRGITLEASDEAKQRLVDLGYEPSLGARPLERAIVRWVQDPLAEGLLAGRFGKGQTVMVKATPEGVGVEGK
jgi:ATP-dependent Clp protease ATP-binding subunit ClpB